MLFKLFFLPKVKKRVGLPFGGNQPDVTDWLKVTLALRRTPGINNDIEFFYLCKK